ncbi:MAG: hypothetical protein KGL35_28700 [Bradyrhizobium sp.]|nr:hypothetical protein [Pseudomonadota bacterium]MDE2067772.1 hypothetical protein [Bradyrhizobium sp.]MDE2472601.1 hypothetical protein [Bradyrhizobium sp.]
MSGVRIGIDFDNTIICYDEVFAAAARQRGLVPDGWTSLKSQLRDYLRAKPGGELAWQSLQGWVYGKGIGNATIFPGLLDFLAACRRACADVYIVSHKTRYGHQDPDRTDLRIAARDWIRGAGLIGAADSTLHLDRIYFEDTLAAKIDRLASLDLDVFIDDLIEVFEQPHFPQQTRPILFASPPAASHGRYRSTPTWAAVQREVFAT